MASFGQVLYVDGPYIATDVTHSRPALGGTLELDPSDVRPVNGWMTQRNTDHGGEEATTMTRCACMKYRYSMGPPQ